MFADEILSNVSTNYVKPGGDQCYLRGVGNTCQNSLKDEQVLKKLTEMNSHMLDTEEYNVLTTTRSNTYTNIDLNPSYKLNR